MASAGGVLRNELVLIFSDGHGHFYGRGGRRHGPVETPDSARGGDDNYVIYNCCHHGVHGGNYSRRPLHVGVVGDGASRYHWYWRTLVRRSSCTRLQRSLPQGSNRWRGDNGGDYHRHWPRHGGSVRLRAGASRLGCRFLMSTLLWWQKLIFFFELITSGKALLCC